MIVFLNSNILTYKYVLYALSMRNDRVLSVVFLNSNILTYKYILYALSMRYDPVLSVVLLNSNILTKDALIREDFICKQNEHRS